MARGLSFLDGVPRAAMVILMVILLVDVMLGVFFRYVVGRALSWTEEVGTLSLVWLTFISGAVGVHRGAHFAIHLFVERLGPAGRRAASALAALLIMLLGVLLVVYGWRLVQSNAGAQTPALGLNLGILYASAVVGGLLMACYAVPLLLGAVRGRDAVPDDPTATAELAGV